MKRLACLALATTVAAVAHACGCGDPCGCTDEQYVPLATEKATAKIALDGARVVSFKVGGEEVIWTTRIPADPQARWSHGGIPVCWPWFGSSGGHGKKSMHGFAKSCRFELVSSFRSRDRSQVVLRLRSDDRTRKIWPHDFELVYEISVSALK